MIGDNLEIYTFEYLLNQALSNVPDTVDKRQGSIIYDALAPACYQLANFYMNLRDAYRDVSAETASGEGLDLIVSNMGILRQSATYSVKKIRFENALGAPISVPLGSRFSTMSDSAPLNYKVTAPYTVDNLAVSGEYEAECETAGTVGNEYSGNLISISFVQGLATAEMSDLIIPARNTETDEELRLRYFDTLSKKPFGGNVAQYNEEIKAISGVGEVQVYPVWDGGGTVKCCIVDAEYNAATSSFIEIVQEIVDPEVNAGEGMGIAPVGHVVTITTPEEVEINVAATITVASGYSLPQIQQSIITAIESYLALLRQQWGIPNDLNEYALSVYLAKMISYILNVPGVSNVTEVTINDLSQDLVLQQDASIQQLPILGTVTLT